MSARIKVAATTNFSDWSGEISSFMGQIKTPVPPLRFAAIIIEKRIEPAARHHHFDAIIEHGGEHRIVPAMWAWFEFPISLAEGGAASGSYAAQWRRRSAEWSRQQPQSNLLRHLF